LADARPEIPDSLFAVSDRYADCWEPLIAIADLAGGDWPRRAHDAALELAAIETHEDESIGVRLLADVERAFAKRAVDRLPTARLIDALSDDETAPWNEWNRGQRISPRQVAQRLQPFGIRPRTIRLEDGTTAKGYHREQFADAWKR
jgi:hypothetical protein